MADWPTSLPGFMDGLQEQRVDGFVRTPTDIGPGQQRRRYSAVPHFFNGQMTLTQAQRTTFEAFYNATLRGGADAFTMQDPSTGQDAQFRFTAAPSFSLFGGAGGTVHIASISLERLP